MTVSYKGVNLAGLEFGSGIGSIDRDYALPGKSSYDYWGGSVGSNVIRLPFKWERLQKEAFGELDQTYLGYLKSSVQWAKENGMSIALDLHNYARYNGQVVGSNQLTDVWKKLAAEFGGDDSVWFNLMNEPYNVSATQWANTTQATVNDLRAAGIDNKLLLSGTSWSGAHSWISSGNAAAYDNFKDPMNNFAFDVHQYLDSDSSGTSGTAVPGSGSTRLVKVTEWAEANGFQLFLGEAGVAKNDQSIKEMGDMMQYMENHSEAWLGWSLWSAGPWWGNYYFEVNPQGSEHDPAILALMKYMKPGATTEPQPGPTDPVPTDPEPTDPEPTDPEPTDPATGITAGLNNGTDNIQGTAGNDKVQAWYGQIESGDKVSLGEGYDTLLIRNTGLPLVDTKLMTGFSGVDNIDITASDGWAKVVLSEAFIAQSDNDSVTVTYGSKGIGSVVVDSANKDDYQFDYGTNKVTVTYKGGTAPTDPVPTDPTPTDPVPTDPTPTDPVPTDPVVGITAGLNNGTDNIQGTAGNDKVQAWYGQIESGDKVSLGQGYDTLLIRNTGLPLVDTRIMAGFSGVDNLDITASDGWARVVLSEAFIAQSDSDSVTVTYGSKGIGSVVVDSANQGDYQFDYGTNKVTVTYKGGTAPTDPVPTDPTPTDPTPTDPEPTDPVVITKPAPEAYDDVAGVTTNVKTGKTDFTGTSNNDTLRAFDYQLGSNDKVQLGEGHDTLSIRTTTPNIDTAKFPNITGVDLIDLSASKAPGMVKLGNTFLDNSDHDEVTINFGNHGLRLLDTSALDHAKYDVFIYGQGDVFLSEGNDKVTVINGAQGKVHGEAGDDAIFGDIADDTLYGGDGMDFLYGHDGNDVLEGGLGADVLIGGAGDDTFVYSDIAEAGDIIQGFEAGDQLDLNALLDANELGGIDSAVSGGFVQATQNGANTVVSFDADGSAGAGQAVTMVTLENANLNDLAFATSTVI